MLHRGNKLFSHWIKDGLRPAIDKVRSGLSEFPHSSYVSQKYRFMPIAEGFKCLAGLYPDIFLMALHAAMKHKESHPAAAQANSVAT